MKQIVIATVFVMAGCGGSAENLNQTTGVKSTDPHLLQTQADALQRAKDAAESLEAASRRSESEIEKSRKD